MGCVVGHDHFWISVVAVVSQVWLLWRRGVDPTVVVGGGVVAVAGLGSPVVMVSLPQAGHHFQQRAELSVRNCPGPSP